MKKGKFIKLIIIFSMFIGSCEGQKHVYTDKDLINDTLSRALMFSSPYEVEMRNTALLNKYVYPGNSSEGTISMAIGFCVGNIERYTGQLPESRSRRLNEAPEVFGKRWEQIEPLYTKVLAAIRSAILDHPQSAILFEHSALLKCTINDLAEAIRDMLIAIKLKPTSYRYLKLGFFYELDNQLTKSCESLRKARDLGASIDQSTIRRVCNR